MSRYSLSHLADHTLLHYLSALVTQDRVTTADLLAHLAEVDERKLYLPAAYSSMHAYCVGELRLSEDAAWKRLQAARVARKFPVIFEALADGRLHLTGLGMLSPHLASETADDLLKTAFHKTKAAIALLLAERFPQPDLPSLVEAIAPVVAGRQHAPGRVQGVVSKPAPAQVAVASRPAQPAKLAPLAPQRFALQLTIAQATHDKLRRAQELLGHSVPSGDIAKVLDRALDALIERLEKRKFAATAEPRPRRATAKGRHIPAAIRREVCERDGRRCTFVSDKGHRCQARTRLEFDHLVPIARGGETTAAGLRLRCRAHNQYAAECAFGAGFMRRKRTEARRRGADAGAGSPAPEDVKPWLRSLGFRAEEARRGEEACAHLRNATLEARIKLAVSALAPRGVRRSVPVPAGQG